MKKENGISMVTLVITIIIMLILAGVAMSMVMGDGSLLEQATTASDNTRGAEVLEYVELIVASNGVTKYSGKAPVTKNTVISDLANEGLLTETEVTYLSSNDTITIGDVTIDFNEINESINNAE